MSHPVFAVNDGKYTVTSQYSQTEGLASKDGSLTADKAVVAVAPSVTESLLSARLSGVVRWGVTLDKNSLIATIKLPSSGLFLSYDFVAGSVVINNDSQPAWIVTPYSGGQTQYRITPLTAPTKFLTFVDHGAQVTIADELTATSDIPKQVWNISG